MTRSVALVPRQTDRVAGGQAPVVGRARVARPQVQHLPHPCGVVALPGVPQAEVADFVEAARQHVLEEAAHELVAAQAAGSPAAGLAFLVLDGFIDRISSRYAGDQVILHEIENFRRFFVKTKAIQDIHHACNIIKLGNYDHQELERFMVKMLRRSRGNKEVYDKALQLQEFYLAMNAQKSFGPKIP